MNQPELNVSLKSVSAVVPTLRVKMRVASVLQSMSEIGTVESETVKLQVVHGREGTVNNQWSKWTPSGEYSITINNPNAIGKLSKGAFYFVDFTLTDANG